MPWDATSARKNFGIFVGDPGYGALFAHEIGHFFCLPHPHSEDDPAEVGGEPNHDHDLGYGIADTPADPAPREDASTAHSLQAQLEADLVYDVATETWAFNDGHDFCNVYSFDNDPGSPAPEWCTTACYRHDAGAFTPLPHAPSTALLMSYYAGCNGPGVFQGDRTEAFSIHQIGHVQDCLAQHPDRTGLVDICAGLGGDTDHDGWCDALDACPRVADPTNAGPLCMGCPAGTDVDTDLDGIDDGCDDDDDNDGCIDVVDEDPLSNKVVVGRQEGCLLDRDVYGYAGDDPDHDGLASCEDPDDDNDGVPDAIDPCNDADPAPCVIEDPDGCWPTPTCTGVGCHDVYELVLMALDDPDDALSFGAWQVGDDFSVWVAPQDGWTVSETARALGGAPLTAPGALRLELRLDGRPIETLAEFDADEIDWRDITHGAVAALTPTPDDGVIIGAAWGAGLATTDLPVDSDRDGWPDTADLCTHASDPLQRDADGDGFGDACDADLDGDGSVTRLDVDRVTACLGLSLAPPPLVDAPRPIVPIDPADQRQGLRARCKAADLDGSGEIDASDLALVQRAQGGVPGPSARAR